MEQNGTYAASSVILAYYEGVDRNEVVRLYDQLVVEETGETTHLVGRKKYTEFRGAGRESAFSIALMSLTKRALEAEEQVKDLEEKNQQLRAQYVQLEKDDLELIDNLRDKNLELNKLLEQQNQNISELDFKLETEVATSKAHEQTVEQQRDAYRKLQTHRDILKKKNDDLKATIKAAYEAHVKVNPMTADDPFEVFGN